LSIEHAKHDAGAAAIARPFVHLAKPHVEHAFKKAVVDSADEVENQQQRRRLDDGCETCGDTIRQRTRRRRGSASVEATYAGKEVFLLGGEIFPRNISGVLRLNDSNVVKGMAEISYPDDKISLDGALTLGDDDESTEMTGKLEFNDKLDAMLMMTSVKDIETGEMDKYGVQFFSSQPTDAISRLETSFVFGNINGTGKFDFVDNGFRASGYFGREKTDLAGCSEHRKRGRCIRKKERAGENRATTYRRTRENRTTTYHRYNYIVAVNASAESKQSYTTASGHGSAKALIHIEDANQTQLFYSQGAFRYEGWLDTEDASAAYFHVPSLSLDSDDFKYQGTFTIHQHLKEPMGMDIELASRMRRKPFGNGVIRSHWTEDFKPPSHSSDIGKKIWKSFDSSEWDLYMNMSGALSHMGCTDTFVRMDGEKIVADKMSHLMGIMGSEMMAENLLVPMMEGVVEMVTLDPPPRELTPVPSAGPTLKPMPAPTNKRPPSPTLRPSLDPTTDDTVRVTVTVTMSASAAPTDNDKTILKATIASVLSLDVTSIQNFIINSCEYNNDELVQCTEITRRLLGASGALSPSQGPAGREGGPKAGIGRRVEHPPRSDPDGHLEFATRRRLREGRWKSRRLVIAYEWIVSFDVVVSLSTLNDDSISSGGDLAKAVSKTLSADLGDAVAAAGIDATVESVVSESATDDSTDDNSSDDGGKSSVAAIAGGSVGGAVLLFGAIAFGMYKRRRKLQPMMSAGGQSELPEGAATTTSSDAASEKSAGQVAGVLPVADLEEAEPATVSKEPAAKKEATAAVQEHEVRKAEGVNAAQGEGDEGVQGARADESSSDDGGYSTDETNVTQQNAAPNLMDEDKSASSDGGYSTDEYEP
jgi:hypothetical protein